MSIVRRSVIICQDRDGRDDRIGTDKMTGCLGRAVIPIRERQLL